MSLVLVSKENKKIDVSFEEIKNLKIITSMLNIENDAKDTTYELNEDIEVPLDISYEILKKILEFINYELEHEDTNDQEKELFYNQYFICSDTILFDLMNSVDYLDYNYLLDKACEKLSDDILKCDSVEDVKTKFQITREFTDKEETQILESAKM
tara:strand:- start:108 stop:572 length:465 start_codon:yes stop_codon:yes gene_type:complete